jgi:hypothetical protein
MMLEFAFANFALLTILISPCSIQAFTISKITLPTNWIPLQLTTHTEVKSIETQFLHVPSTFPSFSSEFALQSSVGSFDWGTEGDVEDNSNENQIFDQGVDNPFKRPDLMDDDGTLKIDPARLLSPRMNGSNMYLVGMMGSGKSAVGKIIAKRT